MTRVGRHDDHPVGLGPAAGQLGDRHRRRHPDRAGDALLVVDGGAQLLGDLAAASPSRRVDAADVEERLVEREHLDQRGDPAEGLHHRGRHRARRSRSRGRPRTACGHSRRARVIGIAGPDPVRPGVVVGRQHHPAVPAADDHRHVAQLGPVADRDRRVEGVHVDVQDRRVHRVVDAGAVHRSTPAVSGMATGLRSARVTWTLACGEGEVLGALGDGAARARPGRAVAPGSRSSSEPGTRSEKTRTPCTASARSPAAASRSASSSAVNRRPGGRCVRPPGRRAAPGPAGSGRPSPGPPPRRGAGRPAG